MKNLLRDISLVCAGLCLVAVAILSLRPHPDTSSVRSTAQRENAPNVLDQAVWGPVFTDEFSETTLDTAKWVTCYDWRVSDAGGCTNPGNQEQEWYTDSHITLAGGAATLTATHEPVTIIENGQSKTYPYQSGMISTGRPNTAADVKWSGTYGYYEARMKVQGGQGVWPAFWLLPTSQKWPPEIDIMELLGGRTNRILLTSHWADALGKSQEDSSTITGPDFTKGWHTYAVNWQPGRIDWYIDGRMAKSVRSENVSSEPMEIILNLAIGGRLPGNADSTTPFPRTAQIDYVRVYGLKLEP